jgi:hypothetical protein
VTVSLLLVVKGFDLFFDAILCSLIDTILATMRHSLLALPLECLTPQLHCCKLTHTLVFHCSRSLLLVILLHAASSIACPCPSSDFFSTQLARVWGFPITETLSLMMFGSHDPITDIFFIKEFHHGYLKNLALFTNPIFSLIYRYVKFKPDFPFNIHDIQYTVL